NLNKSEPPVLKSYSSAKDFIKDSFNFIKSKNPSFSLRAFGKKLEIPVSTLSSYINGNSSLSLDQVIKFIDYFKFSEKEIENFLIVVAIERNSTFSKTGMSSQLQTIESRLPDREVYDYLKNLEPAREFRYGIKNAMTFRVLMFFRDKVTKKPSPHFLDKYFSAEHQIASIGHFYKKANGYYQSFLERGFDRNAKLECLSESNRNLAVIFDGQGFPTIENFTISILHSKELVFGKLIFNNKSVTIIGKKVDPTSPKYPEQKYFVEFPRL
ncbi:hypothetical protein COB52_04315, partial [Candidatus Kaiserbacteria bacterium]